jgi:hypothetical protein
MPPSFISESIHPEGAFDAAAMARGEPGLPTAFSWRGETYPVTRLVRSWRSLGADRTHGSAETYLQRHFYELEVADGSTWVIYFDRQARGNPRDRWRLYTIEK